MGSKIDYLIRVTHSRNGEYAAFARARAVTKMRQVSRIGENVGLNQFSCHVGHDTYKRLKSIYPLRLYIDASNLHSVWRNSSERSKVAVKKIFL